MVPPTRFHWRSWTNTPASVISPTGTCKARMHRTWADISLTALRHNFHRIRTRVGPGVAVTAVVKADAYGHGAAECARTLAAEGAAWMAVSSTGEGVELRAAGIAQPILLLSGYLPGDEAALAEHALTPMVLDEAQV